eukprot:6458326-Amphidinium_carterae.1
MFQKGAFRNDAKTKGSPRITAFSWEMSIVHRKRDTILCVVVYHPTVFNYRPLNHVNMTGLAKFRIHSECTRQGAAQCCQHGSNVVVVVWRPLQKSKLGEAPNLSCNQRGAPALEC